MDEEQKKVEEQIPPEEIENGELNEEEAESEDLPFPNARVVKIIKANLTNPHQIKRDVKIAANELLGEIMGDIAKSMNNEEYFTLSIEHFNKAARKYREIGLAQKRVYKIKKVLEKQRAELDEIVCEIDIDLPENKGTLR
ncbi:MAG: hypothetical protein V1834_00150 [Candidatus Micrarchaeota archaeon]